MTVINEVVGECKHLIDQSGIDNLTVELPLGSNTQPFIAYGFGNVIINRGIHLGGWRVTVSYFHMEESQGWVWNM